MLAVPAVLAVIPVTYVVLLFSLFTGLATESFKLTTKFLFGLIVYLSGDLESPTGFTCTPRVYALLE